MDACTVSVLVLSDRVVALDQHAVLSDGQTLAELTPLEVTLLRYLAEHRDEAVDRDELLQRVWGYAATVRSRAIDKTVHRLRIKLERDPAEPRHLQGVRGLGYRLTGVAAQQPDAAVSNLPEALRPVFGLEAATDALAGLLKPVGAVVAVVAPPGAGKSTLAQALGRRLHEQGWTCWGVQARGAASVERLAERVCDAVGAGPSAKLGPVETARRAAARSGPVLLVLDGCEGQEAALVALLQGMRGLSRWLLLSREELPETGAVHWRLPPLSPEAGAALLRDRAGRAGAALGPHPALEALSQALGGHAGSLALLAPRLALLSPDELLASVRRALSAAEPQGARWAASLGLAVAEQWGSLSPRQRDVLAACAAFPSSFTAAQALALHAPEEAEDVLDALESALARGALHPESAEAPRRAALHPPLRARALRHLAAAGRLEATERRVAALLAEEAEALEREVRGGDAGRGFAGLERIRLDLLAGVERWSGPDPALALRLAVPLGMVQIRRHPSSFAAQIAALRPAAPDPATALAASSRLAAALRRAGRLDEARALGQELLRVAGPEAQVARAEALLILAGSGIFTAERTTEAIAEIQEALLHLERSGELRLIWRLRLALGIQLGRQGRYEEALAITEAAAAHYEARGDAESLALALNNQLEDVIRLGREAEAARVAEAVLAACARAQDRVQLGWVNQNLAAIHWERGELAEMAAHAEQARRLAVETGDVLLQTLNCESFAFIAVERGSPEEARTHFDAYRRGAEQIGAEVLRFAGVAGGGLVDHLQGALPEALAAYDACVAFAPGRSHRLFLRWVLVLRALARAERGDRAAAEADLAALRPFLAEPRHDLAPYQESVAFAEALLDPARRAALGALAPEGAGGHEARLLALLRRRAAARVAGLAQG